MSFLNEAINNSDTFDINAIILKDTPIDLIIGRETIKKNQLFRKIPSQLDVSTMENTFSEGAKNQCGCQPNGDLQPQLSSPTVAQLESEQLLGIPLPEILYLRMISITIRLIFFNLGYPNIRCEYTLINPFIWR